MATATTALRDATRRLHPIIYQSTAGIIGHRVRNGRTLLLHTTGRRSGRTHTVALRYVRDTETFVVIGSNRGALRDPDWVRNLALQPHARIQVGSRTLDVTATITTAQDDPALWRRATTRNPRWATYQKRATRPLPLVTLTPRNPKP